MKKNQKKPRKERLFSVSFTETDMKELVSYLEDEKRQHGLAFSRNEFIRRSVLASVRTRKNGGQDFIEQFKLVE